MTDKHIKIIKKLTIWKGEIDIKSLGGGLTNHNFLVIDGSQKLVVRLGKDILEHHVLRSNELISSKAAYEAGVGPEVVFNAPGVLIIKYIESQTMSAKDVRDNIDKIIPLIKKVHYEVPKKLFGPAMIFWVFHVVRNYAKFLESKNSSHIPIINKLLSCNDLLEKISSPRQIVYGHNDLLHANFLNDGSKIWLIDWEYSGFNDPLFDLGGLSSNNDFSKDEEMCLLETYFDNKIDPELIKKYQTMKCASLLRETMWSMVSELTSKIDFDYEKYTQDNLAKFEASFKKLKEF